MKTASLANTKSLSAYQWVAATLFFTLLTAAGAHLKVYLPFTPVPVTFQTLFIVMAGAFLGSRGGLASQIVLLVLAAIGLPVLSQTSGGISVLWGATGGYIFGFLLCAYFTGLVTERKRNWSFFTTYAFFFATSLFVLVPGTLWLKWTLNLSYADAISKGFTPFLIGDVLKTLLASCIFQVGMRFSFKRR